MAKEIDAIEQATALLESVAGARMDALGDVDLVTLLERTERAGRLLDASRALLATEVDERSRFDHGRDGLAYRHGHRRAVHFIEHVTRVSSAEAKRRIRLGAATTPTPLLSGDERPPQFEHVAKALREGRIGEDAALAIVRHLGQAGRVVGDAELRDAESALVAQAEHQSADLVEASAVLWREALDPDGVEPRDREARSRRSFTLGRERNGLTPFSGLADAYSAGLLRAALAERGGPDATPRFLDRADVEAAGIGGADAGGAGMGVAGMDGADASGAERAAWRGADPRTRAQRQFDIVMGLLTAGIRVTDSAARDASVTGAPVRSLTNVTVVVRMSDLVSGSGSAWIDDVSAPVSMTTVRGLVCDSGFDWMLCTDEGRPLHLGRSRRLFSSAQRRALAVRDGGCVWPHCTAPPAWCEAHHVDEWLRDDGPTDVDNGVLLCRAHHHMLHDSEFELRMRDGLPQLLAPPWIDPDQEWRPVGGSRVLASVGRD